MRNRIRLLREKNGFTAKELGKVFGLAESTIIGYELGRRNPDIEVLDKIADFFDVSVDYILYRANIPEDLTKIFVEIPEEDIEKGLSPSQVEEILKIIRKVKKEKG